MYFFFFVGANPTLNQLRDNLGIYKQHYIDHHYELIVLFFSILVLGKALYVPSYVSFLRYAEELYYLIEIKTYHTGTLSMKTLYGYDPEYVMSYCY
jgi:hypothetical protein